jgi:peptidoglycan/xylan/chitin deacetylase (PgdA/CDA1 family)
MQDTAVVWSPNREEPAGKAASAETEVDNPVTTIVSLTFDDGHGSQYTKAAPILDKYDVHGTFYVNSGTIGTAAKMSWPELVDLRARGHDIGGHSMYHPDFRNLDSDEIARQICDDRVALLNHGLQPTSFAYPFGHGANDAEVREMVRKCGYNSGRRAQGLVKGSSCRRGGRCAEEIPARDPYAIRVPISPGRIQLSWLEAQVVAAEQNGGGWIPFVFHNVCDCSGRALATSTLDAFLAWMKDRARAGTVVRSVAEVVGGELAPAVAGPSPTPRSGNLLRNNSLETPVRADPHGHNLPAECWSGGAGNSGGFEATWTLTGDAHTGVRAIRLKVTSLGKQGRAALVVVHDLGMCAVPVQPAREYEFAAWYRSDSPVVLVADYQADGLDWAPVSLQVSFPAAAQWSEASAVVTAPANATELSVGLGLTQVGAVTMDDFALFNAGGR